MPECAPEMMYLSEYGVVVAYSRYYFGTGIE
jgi:hypothetical protein